MEDEAVYYDKISSHKIFCFKFCGDYQGKPSCAYPKQFQFSVESYSMENRCHTSSGQVMEAAIKETNIKDNFEGKFQLERLDLMMLLYCN